MLAFTLFILLCALSLHTSLEIPFLASRLMDNRQKAFSPIATVNRINDIVETFEVKYWKFKRSTWVAKAPLCKQIFVFLIFAFVM